MTAGPLRISAPDTDTDSHAPGNALPSVEPPDKAYSPSSAAPVVHFRRHSASCLRSRQALGMTAAHEDGEHTLAGHRCAVSGIRRAGLLGARSPGNDRVALGLPGTSLTNMETGRAR
jgi:hypothetical protein